MESEIRELIVPLSERLIKQLAGPKRGLPTKASTCLCGNYW